MGAWCYGDSRSLLQIMMDRNSMMRDVDGWIVELYYWRRRVHRRAHIYRT